MHGWNGRGAWVQTILEVIFCCWILFLVSRDFVESTKFISIWGKSRMFPTCDKMLRIRLWKMYRISVISVQGSGNQPIKGIPLIMSEVGWTPSLLIQILYIYHENVSVITSTLDVNSLTTVDNELNGASPTGEEALFSVCCLCPQHVQTLARDSHHMLTTICLQCHLLTRYS